MLLILVLIIIGMSVGALTGITGASGVVVVVPILTILGLSFQEAVGSSLLVDVITTAIVIYTYMKKKSASVTIALMMGLGAVLGAQIGARIAVSVDQLPLEILFIALAVIMGYHAFRRSYGKGGEVRRSFELKGNPALIIVFLLSIPVGVLTGTLGTSGGIMFLGIIMLIFPMSAQKMIGTATLAMMLSAISGVIGYAYFGRIDVLYAVIIGAVSFVSGYFFSILAHSIDERMIYRVLGSVFEIVAFIELLKITALMPVV
ncbi:MAG: sulfite exporter TauE/SafE family protein [Candidatus Thermoplasmatota archaeon]|nr:sulfite exporter TauE/SafE family protein [Candidatus Thermoplasmatota archaeon]